MTCHRPLPAHRRSPEKTARRRAALVSGALVFVAAAALLPGCAKNGAEPAPAATQATEAPEEEEQKQDEAAKPKPAAQPSSVAPARPPAAAEPRRRAGLPGTTEDDADELDIETATEQLQAAFAEVERALELSTPDCSTAKTLRDRVCELAEHICRLAEESSASSAATMCEDGRKRCGEVKAKFDATCASP